MKKLLIGLVVTMSMVNAWQLKEVIESEGIQTNLIECDNGKIKILYFNSKNGKYEFSPTITFNTIEEGAGYICEE